MAVYSSVILAETSLVAYFRLGETVGSTTVTDSKAGNTAASTGISTILGVTGILGNQPSATGASFIGTGLFTGSAGLQTALNFERTNPFSIEAWINPSVGRGVGVQTQPILDHRSNNSANQGYINFLSWNGSASKTQFQFQINNNIAGGANCLVGQTTTIDFANGTTYHVVFTYDGSSTGGGCHLYVNGVEFALTITTSNLSASIQTTQVPVIGNIVAASLPWQGTLQELAVYNSALSNAVANWHYQVGLVNNKITNDAAVATTATTTTTPTIALSTSQLNDVIYLTVYSSIDGGSAAPTVSSVSGGSLTWAKRSGLVFSPGTPDNGDVETWWALAASPLNAVTVTVTLSGAPTISVLTITAWNGCNVTNSFDPNGSVPSTAALKGSTPTATGINTTNADDLLLAVMANRNGSSSDITAVPTGFSAVVGAVSTGRVSALATKMVTTQQMAVMVSWGSFSVGNANFILVDALTADTPTAVIPAPVIIQQAVKTAAYY